MVVSLTQDIERRWHLFVDESGEAGPGSPSDPHRRYLALHGTRRSAGAPGKVRRAPLSQPSGAASRTVHGRCPSSATTALLSWSERTDQQLWTSVPVTPQKHRAG